MRDVDFPIEVFAMSRIAAPLFFLTTLGACAGSPFSDALPEPSFVAAAGASGHAGEPSIASGHGGTPSAGAAGAAGAAGQDGSGGGGATGASGVANSAGSAGDGGSESGSSGHGGSGISGSAGASGGGSVVGGASGGGGGGGGGGDSCAMPATYILEGSSLGTVWFGQGVSGTPGKWRVTFDTAGIVHSDGWTIGDGPGQFSCDGAFDGCSYDATCTFHEPGPSQDAYTQDGEVNVKISVKLRDDGITGNAEVTYNTSNFQTKTVWYIEAKK